MFSRNHSRNFCLDLLDENPKVNQLEDDRFSRMEHFYGSDEIDPETLEDLDLGGDGKVNQNIPFTYFYCFLIDY